MHNPVQVEPYSGRLRAITSKVRIYRWRRVVLTEPTLLPTTPQSESEIVSGIRTAAAADKFAQRQRVRRHRRQAPLQISDDDMARMVKEFAATHGGIVMCPTAYAVQSDQYRI
jgi:hypothetical protein